MYEYLENCVTLKQHHRMTFIEHLYTDDNNVAIQHAITSTDIQMLSPYRPLRRDL